MRTTKIQESNLSGMSNPPGIMSNPPGNPPGMDRIGPTGPVRTSEVRTVNAKTGGAKGSKLARISLIPPKCIWELGEHYGKGSLKYADRNWEKGYDWHLSYDAMMHHALAFWMGEDIDPETGSHHLIAVAWHAFCLRTFFEKHPDLDDRPEKVTMPPAMPDLGQLEDMFWEKNGGKPNG